MSKFNTKTARPGVFSPVKSEARPSGRTHQGGAGYARDTKSELFVLAISNMVGTKTFYEPGGHRDERYAALMRAATLADPTWTAGFLKWLRTEMGMRSASLVGAAEFVKARLEAGLDEMNRQVVDSVLGRADEPGEFMAYWHRYYGRTLSMPVKRGLADAALRLYKERSLLKWDTVTHAVRFADVIDLVRPKPKEQWRSDLFRYALDRRHGHDDEIPVSLRMVRANARLRRMAETRPAVMLDAEWLADAGMTWEDALSMVGSRVDKAQLWEAMIPSMRYEALLKNLRNFDQAGVSDKVAAKVIERLTDPEQVAKSRLFPMQFLAAYRAAPSLRWAHALERAITHSLSNVPGLMGRTLILVDTSSSMDEAFSKDGSLMRWDAAVVFGLALGARCEHADVVSFSSARTYWSDPIAARTKVFPMRTAESLLKAVDRWKAGGFFLGGGTDTAPAIQQHLRPGFHNRLVILTDEQTEQGDVGKVVPADIPMYTYNLAGYEKGQAPSGGRNRHVIGGLTDKCFRMIPLLEAGQSAKWPWEQTTSAVA